MLSLHASLALFARFLNISNIFFTYINIHAVQRRVLVKQTQKRKLIQTNSTNAFIRMPSVMTIDFFPRPMYQTWPHLSKYIISVSRKKISFP